MVVDATFGTASAQVVIEEFLDGIEFSVFALTDGKNYVLLPEAKDYKRIGEGDTGLNTGGMGAYSPAPIIEGRQEEIMNIVMKPMIEGMKKEGKRGFRVYPNWDTVGSKQAEATQKWQLNYFYEINKNFALKKISLNDKAKLSINACRSEIMHRYPIEQMDFRNKSENLFYDELIRRCAYNEFKYKFNDELIEDFKSKNILVIDGCNVDCGKKVMQKRGIDNYEYLRITDLGYEKGKTPFTPEALDVIFEKAATL